MSWQLVIANVMIEKNGLAYHPLQPIGLLSQSPLLKGHNECRTAVSF
nr:hypothetical protein [Bacillus subtilis]